MTQILYVSSPESQQIHVWKLDNSKEKLELIQVICTPGNAQPIIIHPNQQFLYVGIRPQFGIVTYRINQDGLLNKIKITKISNSPTYLTINKNGTFLYCASYNYNMVSTFSINKLGILDSSVQIIEGLLGCHSVNIDNNEKLLWVPCLKEHSIRLFNLHKYKGILTPFSPNRIITNIGSGPRHMTFHGFSDYAYVINELNGTIDVIKYNSKKITPIIIQTLKILPNNKNTSQFWSADIHITPNNRWLYCSDRLANTISCFTVSPHTKQLKFVNYQHTEKQPRGFIIDIAGEFLIVAGQKSNHISLYRINDNNGKLYIISRYQSGNGPTWISII